MNIAYYICSAIPRFWGFYCADFDWCLIERDWWEWRQPKITLLTVVIHHSHQSTILFLEDTRSSYRWEVHQEKEWEGLGEPWNNWHESREMTFTIILLNVALNTNQTLCSRNPQNLGIACNNCDMLCSPDPFSSAHNQKKKEVWLRETRQSLGYWRQKVPFIFYHLGSYSSHGGLLG